MSICPEFKPPFRVATIYYISCIVSTWTCIINPELTGDIFKVHYFHVENYSEVMPVFWTNCRRNQYDIFRLKLQMLLSRDSGGTLFAGYGIIKYLKLD